jgi:hypothetical protein
MTLRKDWDDFDKGQKGDFLFRNNDTYICVRWGDGVEDICILPIAREGSNPEGKHWIWDGNKDAPTLSPSILVHGHKGKPDQWHGYLRAGILETI